MARQPGFPEGASSAGQRIAMRYERGTIGKPVQSRPWQISSAKNGTARFRLGDACVLCRLPSRMWGSVVRCRMWSQAGLVVVTS